MMLLPLGGADDFYVPGFMNKIPLVLFCPRQFAMPRAEDVNHWEMVSIHWILSKNTVPIPCVLPSYGPAGNDQRFRDESVEASRNFSNKIWNASRFVLMNLGDYVYSGLPDVLNRHERWILDRYNEAVRKTTALLQQYELGEAARVVYEFLWGDFCDWYIELIKIPLYAGNKEEKERAKAVLYHVLEGTLRILHPFMPFISEEIWQNLPKRSDEKAGALVIAPWPEVRDDLVDDEAREEMDLIREVIRAMRNLRVEVGIPPGRKSAMFLRLPKKLVPLLEEEIEFMEKLSWVEPITFLDPEEDKPSRH